MCSRSRSGGIIAWNYDFHFFCAVMQAGTECRTINMWLHNSSAQQHARGMHSCENISKTGWRCLCTGTTSGFAHSHKIVKHVVVREACPSVMASILQGERKEKWGGVRKVQTQLHLASLQAQTGGLHLTHLKCCGGSICRLRVGSICRLVGPLAPNIHI